MLSISLVIGRRLASLFSEKIKNALPVVVYKFIYVAIESSSKGSTFLETTVSLIVFWKWKELIFQEAFGLS